MICSLMSLKVVLLLFKLFSNKNPILNSDFHQILITFTKKFVQVSKIQKILNIFTTIKITYASDVKNESEHQKKLLI